jgi:hypothetical protein
LRVRHLSGGDDQGQDTKSRNNMSKSFEAHKEPSPEMMRRRKHYINRKHTLRMANRNDFQRRPATIRFYTRHVEGPGSY